MTETKTNFRCYAKALSLTYSNVVQQTVGSEYASNDAITLRSLFEKLKTIISNSGRMVSYIAMSEEKHQDGSLHYHAGVYLEERWNIRDPRVFDIFGCHPNIQASRNFSKWIDYLKKDGTFLEEGTIKSNKNSASRVTPSELIELAKSMEQAEFLAFCSVHRYQSAKDIWNMVHEDQSLTIGDTTTIEGVISEDFARLADNFTWNPNLTLLIVGESGIGKTTWAKQVIPKPCLFVSHIDDLRKFRPSFHKSILFDDVSILHMPETAQIHLLDQENPRSIHVRYGTARIPAGVAKIFTCNSVPVHISSPAISRRVQLLFCYQDDLERERPKSI